MTAAPKYRFPIYALLLPLVPIFQVSVGNMERTALVDAIWIGVAFLGCYLAIMFALRLLFRRPPVTDLLLAIAFCAIFLPITFLTPGTSRWLWIAGWIIAAAGVLLWSEARRLLPIFFAAGSAALLLPAVWTIATSDVWTKRAAIMQVAATAFPDVPAPTAEPVERPDIYYFIFDRYDRNDYLKKVYGYDSQPFLDELKKRGFFIADEAYSNYQRTAHSVVSSLNFDYLDRMETPETAGKSDWYPIFSMFQDFRIGRFLKAMGYEVHFSGSWWEPTRRIAIADTNHTFYELPEMARVIYEYSLLVDAARWVGLRQADPLYWQCQRSRLMFEDIRAGAENHGDKPKFHFAHFLIPHPPFVTHESGRCMQMDEALGRSRAENYIGQLKYADEQILKMVDALLAAPGPKPIIILQADEGAWPEKYAGDELTILGHDVSNVDWQTVAPEDLKEKMAILSAIYAPRLPASDLTPRMSPVNTFRKVLRTYFNAPIDLLPERHKIYRNNSDLYSFEDVTDVLYGPPSPAGGQKVSARTDVTQP